MIKDKFGRVINVGDVVSYPTRRGPVMRMNDMKVLGFANGKMQVEDRSSVKRHKSWTKNLENVIRIGTESELQAGSAS
jgi:hypothetical protein